MGVICYCCRPEEKEPSENELQKPEENTNTENKTHDIFQNKNNLNLAQGKTDANNDKIEINDVELPL
jgi:hypothetical protein